MATVRWRPVSAGRRARRLGTAHIEFALIMPVLVAFLFGIFEYSWMFFQRTSILEAARRGCRTGAVLSPSDDYQGIVETETMAALAHLGVDCDYLECSVVTTTQGDHPNERLRCEVDVEYKSIINLLPVPDKVTAGYLYYFEAQ